MSALCQLQIAHLDSHADRLCIHVVHGKGGRDRHVPLSADVLDAARLWWRVASPRQWLFTAAREPKLESGTAIRYPQLAQPDAPDGARAKPLALLAALPTITTH